MYFSEVTKLIRSRRSTFPNMYLEKEINDDIIKSILENASWAPTHKNTEPWKFIIYKSVAKNKLGILLSEKYKINVSTDQYSELKQKRIIKKINQSNVVIALILDRKKDSSLPEWEEIASLACAVQNMWLSCTNLNIGCYWSSPTFISNCNDLFELTEYQKCLGLFYMGYKNEIKLTSTRTPIDQKVIWKT